MVIPVTIIGETKIAINEEFADAIPLVIKDLVRNAMKHTPDHDPKVEITLTESELFVEVMIHNNGAISEKLANWFNKSSLEDPENMSKSSKVGLRVVKKWVDLLKIETRYLRDENNDTTTVKLNFPKRISYEKN
jgi:two-component sensor histidine kinase